MASDDLLVYALIATGGIAACLIVIYFINREKRTRKTLEKKKTEADLTGLPFKIGKSVSSNEADRAKEELRILDLEREILGDAIRRLYEAHAEGKITEEERERLAQTYKSRMMTVKDAISKDESVVALHELEAMQEDLLKLFSERFDELTGKIEELRSKAETKAMKEIAVPATKASTEAPKEKASAEDKAKRKKAPSPRPSPRAEAERRIEEIRNEVEKVLDKLGQMEIES